MAAALKPGGVVVLNIVSNPDGNYSRFFKSLLKTVNTVFPESRIYLAKDNDSSSINNIVLVASRTKLDSPNHLGDYLRYLEPVDFSEAMVLTDNYAPVELLAADIMRKF
jgi:hypothetical protein